MSDLKTREKTKLGENVFMANASLSKIMKHHETLYPLNKTKIRVMLFKEFLESDIQ